MGKFIAVLFLLLLIPAGAEAGADCSKITFDKLFNPESRLLENTTPADPETSLGREKIALRIRLARANAEAVCNVGFKCDTVSDVLFEGSRGSYGKSTLWCNQRSLAYFMEVTLQGKVEITCVKGNCLGKHRTYSLN